MEIHSLRRKGAGIAATGRGAGAATGGKGLAGPVALGGKGGTVTPPVSTITVGGTLASTQVTLQGAPTDPDNDSLRLEGILESSPHLGRHRHLRGIGQGVDALAKEIGDPRLVGTVGTVAGHGMQVISHLSESPPSEIGRAHV